MLQGRIRITRHHIPQVYHAMLNMIERPVEWIRPNLFNRRWARNIELDFEKTTHGVKTMHGVKCTDGKLYRVVTDAFCKEAVVKWHESGPFSIGGSARNGRGIGVSKRQRDRFFESQYSISNPMVALTLHIIRKDLSLECRDAAHIQDIYSVPMRDHLTVMKMRRTRRWIISLSTESVQRAEPANGLGAIG
jgi:hypothetical protein